jgi:hypothetical protein
MGKRRGSSSRRKRLDPTSRAQVIIAALGAVAAIAGCAAEFMR